LHATPLPASERLDASLFQSQRPAATPALTTTNHMKLPHKVERNRIAAWIAIGCLALSAQTTKATLLLHYTFDEGSGNALDSSGATPTADGTFTANATRTALGSTPGGTGYALDLTGNGAAFNWVGVTAANGGSKLDVMQKFTLTIWVNMRSAPANTDRLLGRLSTTPFPGFDFMIGTPNSGTLGAGNFKLAMAVDTSSAQGSTADTGADGTWRFVALTYDGSLTSQNVRFYTGGTNTAVTQLGSAITRNAGTVDTTTAEFRIGSTVASGSDRTPPAWMDDARVYNTVLTAEELEAVRQAGGGAVDPTRLIPVIDSQPASWSGYAGAQVSFSVTVSGTAPITQQWYLNGTNAGNMIAGETNLTLVLTNVTTNMSGNFYSLCASNTNGVAWSTNATLTVVAPYDTGILTPIWTLSTGDRSYLIHATGNSPTDRGLSYNPATSNLLFTSRGDSGRGPIIVALDPATGAEKHFLNMSGVSGGTFVMNMVRAADDGAVYGANLTTSATTTSYKLYRWENDDSNTVAVLSFAGDPGYGTAATGLRWGDNLAVRGSGAATQILLAPGSGTNVALFTTANGIDSLPTILTISNVPDHFAQYGLAWGPGTNTFWAKNSESPTLYLVEFDLAAQTGTVLHGYSGVPTIFRGIAADSTQHWLIGAATENPDTARLYDVSDLTAGPVLTDQELFALHNSTAGQPADATFGGNRVFVLDPANGIKAFQMNSAIPRFNITSITVSSGPGVVLNWESVAGHTYQVQSRGSLTSGTWTNLGSTVTATGSTSSFTNSFSGDSQFYRVQGQ
jgi:hypothetical protein